jgi:hypothetical protein
MRCRRQIVCKGNSAAGVKEKTLHATGGYLSSVDIVGVSTSILSCHVNEHGPLCVIIAIRVVAIDGHEAQKQIPEGHGPP